MYGSASRPALTSRGASGADNMTTRVRFPNNGGQLVHRQAAIGQGVNVQDWTGIRFLNIPVGNGADNFVGQRVPSMIDSTTPVSFVRQWAGAIDTPAPASMTPYGMDGTPGASQPGSLTAFPSWLNPGNLLPDGAASAAKGYGIRAVIGVIALAVIILAIYSLVRGSD